MFRSQEANALALAAEAATFQSAIEVYRSISSNTLDIDGLQASVKASERLFTSYTNELSEVLTKLQLGSADFREGSVGYALWGVLQEIENDKCLGKSVNYNVTFEAKYSVWPPASDPEGDRRRKLLVTSGASGSSKVCLPISQAVPQPPNSPGVHLCPVRQRLALGCYHTRLHVLNDFLAREG